MHEQPQITLHTGRTMPVLGLGTWELTNDTAATVAAALDLGYRMIDTSGDYGTQPGIGQGVAQSGIQRDRLFIVTKVEEMDDAYTATKKNLSELGMEYADLMLIHRPPKKGAGVELWEGLIHARNEGLTKDIGVSNYSEERIQELIDATGETPVVNQVEWSPFGWSKALLEFCDSKRIVIQAYSPLTRTKRLQQRTLQDAAQRYHKSPAQILLRWGLQKGVVPLPKANQLEHLREDADVFDFELTAEDMSILDELNENYSTLGTKPSYER